jgi:hypothetical protein
LDPNQRWMLVPAAGHYAIVSAATGMAAGILAGSTSNGATLVERPYSINDPTMEFDLVPEDNGWNLLKNVNSGLYLNDYHAAKTNDSPIVQWAANGLANQNWKIKQHISFGGQYEIKCVESGDAVGVPADAAGTAASVVQMPYGGRANQLWAFTPTSMGYYKLQNVKSGEALSVGGGSFSSGANVVQQPSGTVVSNQWAPVQNSDGTWSFYNLNSGMVLDDPGGTKSEAQFDQWGWNGGANQEFTLISVSQ